MKYGSTAHPTKREEVNFPLGDNTVKIDPNATPNSPGFADNENLAQTSLDDVAGSPENDPATKGS